MEMGRRLAAGRVDHLDGDQALARDVHNGVLEDGFHRLIEARPLLLGERGLRRVLRPVGGHGRIGECNGNAGRTDDIR